MNTPDTVVVALLVLIGLVVAGCVGMAWWVRRLWRRERVKTETALRFSEGQAEERSQSHSVLLKFAARLP